MSKPTAVNNVETFVAVCRVMDMGAGWFDGIGSKGSSGTKLLSVSGDCQSPGIYEVPFGMPVRELLREAGAEDAIAVQIGGPSGQMICPDKYDRTICYDDLATGGSVMVFGPERDILEVAEYFMEFFVEESCGYCTPCPQKIPIPFVLELYNDACMYSAHEDSQWMYEVFIKPEQRADQCTQCKECEEKCPQKIPIAEVLEDCHRLLADQGGGNT